MCLLYFIVKETEAQGGEILCARTENKRWNLDNLALGLRDSAAALNCQLTQRLRERRGRVIIFQGGLEKFRGVGAVSEA